MKAERGPMTRSKQFRVALVGISGYGDNYLDQLLRPEGAAEDAAAGSGEGAAEGAAADVLFCAAIDAFPERCPRLAELAEAGVRLYPDLESFYEKDHADLVVICAPIHLHADLTCRALAGGSNVLCEKPLCVRPEDAEKMMAAERGSGLVVAIGYQWAFSDAVQELKKDILSLSLGKPVCLKTLVLWPRRLSYYTRNSWAGRIRTADGNWVLDSPLNNAMAHHLHNMLYLLGGSTETAAEAADIRAELYRANQIENYDTAALQAFTSGGTELRMYAAHPVREAVDPLVSFRFEDALVETGPDRLIRARFRDGRVKTYGLPDERVFGKLQVTIRCIREKLPVPCGIAASVSHTRCINSIQDFPVADFPGERLRTDGGGVDSLVWVEGLAEEFKRRFDFDSF